MQLTLKKLHSYKRVDYALFAPNALLALQSMNATAVVQLLEQSLYESRDLAAFILRNVDDFPLSLFNLFVSPSWYFIVGISFL